MEVIGLCGRARVGKDTAAAHIEAKYGWRRVGFADELKRIAAEYFGWRGSRHPTDPKGGSVLVGVGEMMRREVSEDFWINKAAEKLFSHDRIVVSDVRYPNEADWIRKHG